MFSDRPSSRSKANGSPDSSDSLCRWKEQSGFDILNLTHSSHLSSLPQFHLLIKAGASMENKAIHCPSQPCQRPMFTGTTRYE